MLEYLQIQNYQTHEKLRIDFGPTITSIVGATDAGKSSILRALRWVCTNEPGGDAFIRHGAKGTTVKLGLDGYVATRRRGVGGNPNTYHLDETEYKAFGRGVPGPIEQLLNLTPKCWQGQHDAPFWFGETAGEVSRQLNAIVNLGIIDTTLAGVARAVNQARTRLQVMEEGLDKANNTYNDLAWVPAFCDAVAEVEAAQEAWAAKHAQAAILGALCQKALQYKATRDSAGAILLAGETVVEYGEAALKAQEQAARLRELVTNAQTYAQAAEIVVPTITAMEKAIADYNKATTRATQLRNLCQNIRAKEEELCRREKELEEAIAAMPTVCPTCGQSLPLTSISKHVHQ